MPSNMVTLKMKTANESLRLTDNNSYPSHNGQFNRTDLSLRGYSRPGENDIVYYVKNRCLMATVIYKWETAIENLGEIEEMIPVTE